MKIAYDNALAHKIEAGSDMFLMPSRYEPSGLNQMYSLKYGRCQSCARPAASMTPLSNGTSRARELASSSRNIAARPSVDDQQALQAFKIKTHGRL